ncbi:hypothetical protein BH10BAC1_BH10BAC1_03310 [soil metagenome]
MFKNRNILFTLTTIFSVCIFSTCRNDKGIPDYNEFPDDVGKLIFTKCATAGCHNDNSKGAAGGLSMESWDKLFEGGNGSACVIPYRSDYSTFFSYINTYADLGVTLAPTMPYNKPALTRAEVTLLKNWIDAGAPSRDGSIKFADNPNRKKFYITNQGCDVVTVFDQKTLLPMRYINVGSSASTESPHMIRVSQDGQYWYVVFLAGQYLEKYRTSDDSFVGRALIGSGYWNTFAMSSNSQKAFCVDLSPTGAKVAEVDLATMTTTIQAGFSYPHGSTLNNTNDTLYLSQQTNSSKIYKIPVSDFSSYSEPLLYTGAVPIPPLNSHEIRFTPDGSKYFVTCQGSSEVRVMQTSNDALLAVIPVGAYPSELSFSTTTPFVYVTCTEDTISFPGKRGSVAVINYVLNSLTSTLYTGHQPHGIEVDDNKKLVYVVNRNATSDGPAPHHSSVCGGRNGYVSFINLMTRTMELTPNSSIKKVEISVDPYSVSTRQ